MLFGNDGVGSIQRSKKILRGNTVKRVLELENRQCVTTTGDTMKSSMKDKVEGTFHEVKGKVKEMVGNVTDNPTMKVEGKTEKMAGKAQEKLGQVKKVFGK